MDKDSNAGRPIIVLVLEAAEWRLIEQWTHEGKLPTLRKLVQGGVCGKISSPGYVSSGCVWASFSCSVNPGKHGFGFFHRQLKTGTYRTIKKYSDDLTYKHFWLTASCAGRRVAVFDIPLTKPEADLNGYFIGRWGDEHPSWKPSSTPKDLLREIVDQFGAHPLHEWYQTRPKSAEEWLRWKRDLTEGVKKRTAIIKYLLNKEPLDLMVVNYAEPHWAGHVSWHLHDETHPEHDPALVSRCGDIILSDYIDLDSAIADIMQNYPGATYFVTSPIGMGSHTGGEIMTPAILRKLGMDSAGGKTTSSSLLPRGLLPGSDGMSRAVQQIEKIISPTKIEKLKKLLPERLWDDWTRRLLSLGTNWKQSKVFVVSGDNASLLRINLKGREPNGLVEPGDEYEQLCKELIVAFSELEEIATSQPAVKKIVQPRDVFWGENIDEMPDLVVVWREGPPIEAVKSPRIGTVELSEYHKRTGGHSEHGFLLAYGPGIQKGVQRSNLDLLDFAPTILNMLGVPVPENMDGKPIDNLFEVADKSGSPLSITQSLNRDK